MSKGREVQIKEDGINVGLDEAGKNAGLSIELLFVNMFWLYNLSLQWT